MNTKILERARALLRDAQAHLEEVRDEEQEAFDAKSDSWKESEAGESMEGRIAALSDAIDELESVDANIETAIGGA
jgi:exonuclease VII small subunit